MKHNQNGANRFRAISAGCLRRWADAHPVPLYIPGLVPLLSNGSQARGSDQMKRSAKAQAQASPQMSGGNRKSIAMCFSKRQCIRCISVKSDQISANLDMSHGQHACCHQGPHFRQSIHFSLMRASLLGRCCAKSVDSPMKQEYKQP